MFTRGDATLSGLGGVRGGLPGVARSSQPQADGFNPFGIGDTSHNLVYSTENSAEPLCCSQVVLNQRVAAK